MASQAHQTGRHSPSTPRPEPCNIIKDDHKLVSQHGISSCWYQIMVSSSGRSQVCTAWLVESQVGHLGGVTLRDWGETLVSSDHVCLCTLSPWARIDIIKICAELSCGNRLILTVDLGKEVVDVVLSLWWSNDKMTQMMATILLPMMTALSSLWY